MGGSVNADPYGDASVVCEYALDLSLMNLFMFIADQDLSSFVSNLLFGLKFSLSLDKLRNIQVRYLL